MSQSSSQDGDERVWKIPRHERAFEESKQFTELALVSCGSSCREATVMAVWELAENAIKYGRAETDATAGTIGICLRDGAICIRARCAAASAESARLAQETIAHISAAPSVGELYRIRQRELFEHPDQAATKLGLLRVAFEGGFRLTCHYEPPELEIVAERPCAP